MALLLHCQIEKIKLMTNKNLKMRKRTLFLAAALSTLGLTANAQMEEPIKDTLTLLQEQIDGNSGRIKKLEKLKVSGYFQAQAEYGQPGASAKTGANSGKYNEVIDGKDSEYFSTLWN